MVKSISSYIAVEVGNLIMFSHIADVLKASKYRRQEKRRRSYSKVLLLRNQDDEIQEKLLQKNEHNIEQLQKQERFSYPNDIVNAPTHLLQNRRNGLCEADMQKDIVEVRLRVF